MKDLLSVLKQAELYNKLLDSDMAAIIDLSSPSHELVIALGGIQGRMGLPDDVFAEIFAGLPKKKILFRDPHHLYYLKGLPGYGRSLNELVDYLRKLIEDNRISRLTLVGNCMGGYTAIVMGILLNADEVHAFLPKTTLRWYHRLRFGDYKKNLHIVKMILRANLVRWDHQKYLDLRKFLKKNPDYPGQIHVYIKENNEASLLHADHIQDLPQVIIHSRKHHKAEIMRTL